MKKTLAAMIASFSISCGGAMPESPTPVSDPTPRPVPQALFAIGGDIGMCREVNGNYDPKGTMAERTAAMITELRQDSSYDVKVLGLGDLVYPDGNQQAFTQCFDPTWGKHKDALYPVPGNHEVTRESGNPPYYEIYFQQFIQTHGGQRYYSFDSNNWHFIGLDSNQSFGTNSSQIAWLRNDLDTKSKPCTVAYFHVPPFSSGPNNRIGGGIDANTKRAWDLLVEKGVDLVFAGHEHYYERFSRMDKNGNPDAQGTRLVIAGGSGASLYDFSESGYPGDKRIKENGIAILKPRDGSYTLQYKSANGNIVDEITDTCR